MRFLSICVSIDPSPVISGIDDWTELMGSEGGRESVALLRGLVELSPARGVEGGGEDIGEFSREPCTGEEGKT